MSLAPGDRLGPYTLRSELGRGGMGVVYTAHDPRLDRRVAIKVLPPGLTGDETARHRFLQEAKAASALDHPNICTIHDVGETPDATTYLVMAYYEGETLRARLARGALESDEAVDVATQIGQGLARAHAAGIVHRDVTPANVMLTSDGTVKILDFGLAKLAGAEAVTQTGTTLGTVAYMSPEQARGEEVDHRTDIWSLGVLLYEMVAGQAPFGDDNLLALSRAIQHEPPPALARGPAVLDRVVRRALHKRPSQRYQAVTDLLAELRSVRERASGPSTRSGEPSTRDEEPSIAVLPFRNPGADPENAYFGEGLAEEVIGALTKVPGLRVIARTSSFRFREEQDLRRVGDALGVRTVLEGSVRRSGARLRITAQLTDVDDDAQVWSERYDRELTDVFVIQDEIAAAIVEKLRVSLVGMRPGALPGVRTAAEPPVSLEAYEALLEGRHHWYTFTPAGAERARACFERALDVSPAYADALASLAHYHGMVAWMFVDPRDSLIQMNALAARALAADPEHGEAHSVLAFATLWSEWDWAEADRLFRRALELAPASPVVPGLYGVTCLLGRGRFTEATARVDRSIELDPLAALIRGNRARVLLCLGRLDEAEGWCRRALEIDPSQLLTQIELGYALALQGRSDAAIDLAEQAVETHGLVKVLATLLGFAYARAGRRDDAIGLLRRLDDGASVYVSPIAATVVHAALSDPDAAFEAADRAVDARDPMMWYLDVHPIFEGLRGDPRYPALRRRVNLG